MATNTNFDYFPIEFNRQECLDVLRLTSTNFDLGYVKVEIKEQKVATPSNYVYSQYPLLYICKLMTDVAIDNIQLFLSYKVNIERYQSEFCCFPEGWKVDNLMFTLYESNECFIIPKLLYFKHISLSTKYRQLIRHKLYTYEAFSVTYKSLSRQYITKTQHYFIHNYLRKMP